MWEKFKKQRDAKKKIKKGIKTNKNQENVKKI